MHCVWPLSLITLSALIIPGCSRSPQGGTQNPPASPRETVARLLEARSSREYQAMRNMIVPERAKDVIAMLAAVDDFLAANDQLCKLARDEIGLGVAEAIDQSQLSYHLDIFSKYVKLMDESITGDTAQVAFLVDEQLPARHAQFRLINGRWRYDPGPGEFAQLGEAFGRMAYGLRQVLDGIRRQQLSLEQLRRNPQELINEVRIRLLPGVKMLPQGPVADAPGGPP